MSQNVGDMWTLRKNGREMVCRLVTHMFSWELRLLISGDLYHSEVCRSEKKVFDTADLWRAEAERKGWADS